MQVQENTSLANLLSSLPEPKRKRILEKLSDEQHEALKWDWKFWARPKQLAPEGNWGVWALVSGRGAGKTRSGAEFIRERVSSGQGRYIHLIGQTPADVRDVMIQGPAGILAVSPPHERPLYEGSKRLLTWPNGAKGLIFSAHDPDKLRGPQCDTVWMDELCAFQQVRDTWTNARFGTRRGVPKTVITTTPKPISLLREIIASQFTVLTTESTYDNRANLAPEFFQQIVSQYEGTSLGEQELYARILDEAQGALWTRKTLSACRVTEHPDLVRIVIGIDPAASSNEDSNETGIIAGGIDRKGHGYILRDLSGIMSPDTWANKAVSCYKDLKADRIVAETNQGGEMVQHTIKTVDRNVAYKGVHASKGKHARAEPIAALFEQGRIHLVGTFPDLEDQLCSVVPGEDGPDDRHDALVWVMTELMLGSGPASNVTRLVIPSESKWR